MHCNEILRVYVNRKHRFSYNKIYTGFGGKNPKFLARFISWRKLKLKAWPGEHRLPCLTARVTTAMSWACTNSMPRKLLCKTVQSDILFVCVSYRREMLVISETQIACYLFEKKTWKNNFVLHTGINILWIFKVKNSLSFSVLYKMSLKLNKFVHKLRETFRKLPRNMKEKMFVLNIWMTKLIMV